MKKLLFFFVAALLSVVGLHGQEKTEQLTNMYGEYSIIREVSDGKWLVYSDVDELSFSLVVDGTSLVNFFFLPNVFKSVADFEIYGDSVFFCGMLKSGVPAMGHFRYSSLAAATPSAPPVTYAEITGVAELTGLELMDIPEGQELHIVMIGRFDDMGILVEAVPNAAGWLAHYILLTDINNNYAYHDDLAITDSHVVVTSYRYTYGPNTDLDTLQPGVEGIIWVIERPMASGMTLVSGTSYYMLMSVLKSGSPFLVTACEGDAFAAAVKIYGLDGIGMLPHINVYGFNGLINIGNVRLVNSTSVDILRDIRYDPLSRTTEILTRYKTPTVDESRIYTLEQSTHDGSTVKGHRYAYQRLNSLIHQSQHSNLFIGTGIDINNNSHLYLYRYNNNSWKICTDNIECKAKYLECGTWIKARLDSFGRIHGKVTKETTLKNSQKITICEQTK